MTRSERGALSQRERALVHERLELTASQAQRLIHAAIGVDASIWRQEMEKRQAQGVGVSSPKWNELKFEKMIPWFECKAQLALDTGMTFVEVLDLTLGDLRLSACETRLVGIGSHPLTHACELALESILRGNTGRALFPWSDRPYAVNLWLRACRNAGLLRGEPTMRTQTHGPRVLSQADETPWA